MFEIHRSAILRVALLLLIAATIAGLPASADNGRVPIPFVTPLPPTIVIDAPGSYVLTRDLVSNSIVIDATDVTLDLDGKTLDPGSGVAGIRLEVGATATIRNGQIIGGTNGVHAAGSNKFILEDLQIRDTSARAIFATTLEVGIVRRVVIERSASIAIALEGSAGSGQAVVTDSTVRDSAGGICVFSGGAAEISRNRLKRITEGPFSSAIFVDSVSAALIRDNVLEELTDVYGIRVSGGRGHKAINNLISNSTGTRAGVNWLGSSGLIIGNVVSGAAAIGLDIGGDGNHIVNNTLSGNGSWGLRFQSSAENNVFRSNVARLNAGVGVDCNDFANADFCDDGIGATNNTSAGDNYAPNPL